MKKLKSFLAVYWLILLQGGVLVPVAAQNRHAIYAGTQAPVQWSVGYGYAVDKHFVLRGQVGLLTPPYDKLIIKSMEAFGFDKKLSKALDESFKLGVIGTLTPQYWFGNNYILLQGQYAHLNGSITLQRAAELYLDVELPDLSSIPFLPTFMPTLTTKSNLFITGVGYGRRFPLPDPRMSIRAEVGFSKILGSVNRFSSNLGTIDEIALIQSYYRQMDTRLKDSYRKYGYIPSLSVYWVYELGRTE